VNRVFMFPGQSSRYPEMLQRVVEAFAPARRIVEQASAVLGRNLLDVYQVGDSAFDRNQDVQVGVFLTSHLYLKALEDNGVDASMSLGLSLGEYNHLVHIGAIDFADALVLVDARGRVYDEGPRGMMAALFPVEADEVEDLLRRAGQLGCVQVANYNTPSQVVLAGEVAAVQEAMRLAEDELSINPVVIEKQIPMHTDVFECVSQALMPHLKAARFHAPKRPYVSNVVGDVVENPQPARIIELLAQHVYSPVRWRQAIDNIVSRHPDSVFVEVGPRGVLYNMLQKRWHANPKFKTDVSDDLTENIGSIRAGVRNFVREARI
jgi:[acyl-carrier-protein] S-malonyltransferase